MLIGVADVFCDRGDAFDFAAHDGAIAFVEIGQLEHAGITERARRGAQKQIREIVSSFEVEIHREKGEVVRDIDKAEAIVELDAVEDGDRVARDVYVFETQIAVTIEDTTAHDAFLKHALVRGEEAVRVVANRFEGCARDRLIDERLDLDEVFVRAQLQFRWAAPFLDLRAWIFRRVEIMQPRDDPVDLVFTHFVPNESLIQEPAVRQLAHLERILDDLVIWCE
jgi:hypothetical protein